VSGERSSTPPASGGGTADAAGCVAGCDADTPYDRRYATAEDAAVAAMQEANPRSHEMNREIGGWVQRNEDGTYTPRPPVTGTIDGLSNMPDRQSNDVAWWHTHGAYEPGYDSENFSEDDRDYSDANSAPGYVATPSGAMRVYDPANPGDGSGTLLPQTTAADPNNP
jgi:hypothetical protein